MIWKGYVKELLAELNRLETNETIKKSKAWATDATRLSKALTRIAPDLRALGIDIINDPKNKDMGGKKIFIEKRLKIASLASSASESPQDKGLRHDANHDAREILASWTHGDKDGYDATFGTNDATKNLASSPETNSHKDHDANDANDAKKSSNLIRGTHYQKTILPDTPIRLPNHYDLEDGDQSEF